MSERRKPCFAYHEGVSCQKPRGHAGPHHCSAPGFSLAWQDVDARHTEANEPNAPSDIALAWLAEQCCCVMLPEDDQCYACEIEAALAPRQQPGEPESANP